MGENYLEDQLLSRTLFDKEELLEAQYLPEKLLHRKNELIFLSKVFVKLIENPFSISRKILITGEVGIGKTAIAKTFGNMILSSSEKRLINMKYIHINCRKEKTEYKILHQILTEIGCRIPKRGYSPQDLMSFLKNYLIETKMYLVLALDELNHMNTTKFDILYSLTRLHETTRVHFHCLSLILIVRNLTLLKNFDDSTLSTMQENILHLKKYTHQQVFDILYSRCLQALKPNVISEDLVSYISSKVHDSGDLRKGLNILRNSVKRAESQDKSNLTKEIIDEVISSTLPSLHNDSLENCDLTQTLILVALCNLAEKNIKKGWIFNEIEEEYQYACSVNGFIPKKHTQIWQGLQFLRKLDFIEIETMSHNIVGRKSFFFLKDVPIEIIQDYLKKKIVNSQINSSEGENFWNS